MKSRAVPAPKLPLTPRVFHILLALVDGPEHGYRIMKDVEERSGGRVRIGPGTLYEAIHRLAETGLIEECASSGGDERRRCYRLTSRGRRTLEAESDRLAEVVAYATAKRLVHRGPA
jgi:DNA-binding PadR family transcriptional regulator